VVSSLRSSTTGEMLRTLRVRKHPCTGIVPERSVGFSRSRRDRRRIGIGGTSYGPALPPNRTGGFPAYGFPLEGFTSSRTDFRHLVQHRFLPQTTVIGSHIFCRVVSIRFGWFGCYLIPLRANDLSWSFSPCRQSLPGSHPSSPPHESLSL